MLFFHEARVVIDAQMFGTLRSVAIPLKHGKILSQSNHVFPFDIGFASTTTLQHLVHNYFAEFLFLSEIRNGCTILALNL